jgi:hypothetical protein
MSWINGAVRGLVEAMLWPFMPFPPLVGLTAIALLVAVAILLVFRSTSDQAAVAVVKRRMHAALFEIRLFNDDSRAILRALRQLLRHNLTYLRLSLAPALWMILPLLLLVNQLQFFFGFDGLSPGGHAVVKVRLDETATPGSSGAAPPLSLDAPAGLRIDTPFVWIASEREAAWRLAAEQPGEYLLTITLAGRSVTKQVRVSDEIGWRAPERLENELLTQLIYPVEPPIADDMQIDSIHVKYPTREVTVFAWKAHWTTVFFLMAILFVFMLRKSLGVVF